MSDRTKDFLLTELRDLIFRGCAAAGGLLGLMAGLDRPPQTPKCKKSDPCMAETLTSGIEAVLMPALIGLVAGAVVGFFIASLFRRHRGSRRPPSKPRSAGRWITARFAGTCRACGTAVRPGDRVLHFREARAVSCELCTPPL